ncbi:MAG TPA: FHA domain-containing protein [Burkholderiaceae bacterium]|nr:FHA domain-containing protein [Burkholderiaceae bacterium]
MGKLVVSLDGVVIKEVQIIKDKTTLGRRPYNDIVIDNLAVSGEHAVLQMVGQDVFIEDLNSTNGTYINGKAVKKQLLAHNDTVEIGKYKIKYLVEEGGDYEKTMIMRQGAGAAAGAAGAQPGFSQTSGLGANSGFGTLGANSNPASIKVLNGAAAGREVSLTKVVTTVGKPGVQVASITKRPGGYVIAHVEGTHRPAINGTPLTGDSVHLKNGDVIELAGTQMQFIQG